MVYQKLHLNYIRGKQIICFSAIGISILGFILDAITYISIYSYIQIWIQCITVLVCIGAFILIMIDKNKYYVLSFGLVSYSVTANIVMSSTVIRMFLSFEKFTQASLLSRNILFIIIYIILSGFILGRKHIIIQGFMLIGLILHFVLWQKDYFFTENVAIYITSSIGFLCVLYFFVGTLNNLIKGLEEATLNSTKQAQLEVKKNQELIKYQNAILHIAKDESIFMNNLSGLFEKICATTAKNITTNRVSIWILDDDNSKLVRKHLFESSGGNSDEVILNRNDFPRYFEALEQSPFIIANDAREHSSTREFKDVYLKPLGIFSMLDCPISIDGKTVGVICCENQHEYKEWSTEDVLFIQSLSSHISIFYKNLEIKDLLEKVRNQNFELIEKSNDIEAMNEELNALNEELTTINESLEITVTKRTFELETQNSQLTEYAFINSHILRAPLARILGLANLISREVSFVNDKQLLDSLIHSSNELDGIIRKISDILYDGNNISREDVQVIIDKTMGKNSAPTDK